MSGSDFFVEFRSVILPISSPFENCVLRERMRSRISRRLNECARLA